MPYPAPQVAKGAVVTKPGDQDSLCSRRARDRFERRREKWITRAVLAGEIDARQLSDYHWRIWLTAKPSYTVDYWPRTGTIRLPKGKNRTRRGPPKVVLELLRERSR